MNRNEMILLKTLFLSTSESNIRKHSNDPKKRKNALWACIGKGILLFLLVIYTFAMCAGYGAMGLTDAIPLLCAATISLVAFFFTVFKVNGYLYGFKEYDMIMSLPFEVKSVVKAKFMYMYLKSIHWYMAMSVAALIGYAIFAKPRIIIYPLWIILSTLLPLLSMILASVAGFGIAKVGSGFKATKMVQTVLSFAIILLAFCSRFVIDAIVRDNKTEDVLNSISDGIDKVGRFYLPIRWFSKAINDLSISDILLFAGVSLLLTEVVMSVVASSYRKINSALMSNSEHKIYSGNTGKKQSAVKAIAFKEFRRMTGSNVYMVNVFMGEVFAFILGLAAIIVGVDKIISIVTNGAPIPDGLLVPAIPFIVFFFIGMVPTTVCSPSLEGKNYWIVQSLPISKKTLYQGKMLFNMYLTVPFSVFATLCMCISAKVALSETIIYVVLGIVLCAFSTCYGLLCGLKFMRLDWENEVEVIKQGTGVVLYIFPNMLLTMVMGVLVVLLKNVTGSLMIGIIITGIYAVITALLYRGCISRN